MKAIVPPKIVTVEMTEFEAMTLIALCNKFSGRQGEADPTYITGQLRDALVESIGGYDDVEDLPPVFVKQIGPENIYLASQQSDLPPDSAIYRG